MASVSVSVSRSAIAVGLAYTCLYATGCGVIRQSFSDLLGLEPEQDDVFADTEGWDDEQDDSSAVPETPPDVGPPEATPTAIKPLERAAKKLPFPARGATDMGFRIDKLASFFALAGAIETPTWSAPSEGDRRVRDNDLDTAWTCVPEGEDRCAIGMHFPGEASIKAVRIYAASSDFGAYPRIKRLRIHTDAGFADTVLPDKNTHVYAQLGEEIRSRNITLEVLELHPGKESVPKIHIAEVEVFGSVGAAREPLKVDPATTYVELGPRPWLQRGRDSVDRAELFIHTIDEAGATHRFMDGTALRGRSGDRILFIERIQAQTACSAPRGTFFVLDTKTRMVAPLGDLGGVGGDTFRAKDGLGLAIGFKGKLDTKLSGLFVENGEYKRRRTPIRADLRTENYFESWELDPEQVPRGGALLQNAGASCVIGDDTSLAELAAAKLAAAPVKKKKRRRRGRKTAEAELPRPGEWQICSLEDVRVFLTDNGPCGSSWEVSILDTEGALVTTRTEKQNSSHMRVIGAPQALLVEVGTAQNTSTLLRVTPSQIEELSGSAATALRPTGACREDDCTAGFPNPHAPVWK